MPEKRNKIPCKYLSTVVVVYMYKRESGWKLNMLDSIISCSEDTEIYVYKIYRTYSA